MAWEARQTTNALSTRESIGGRGFIGEIAGNAAVFGVETDMGDGTYETIDRGAFTSALANKACDTIATLDHIQTLILGRLSAGTLEIWQDDKALRFRIKLADTQTARDTIANIRASNIRGCSFAMAGIRDAWGKNSAGKILRTIRSVNLLGDVSVCTRPQYGQTGLAIGNQPPAIRTVRLDGERLRLLEVCCPR